MEIKSNKHIYNFYDFDGCLSLSPLPDTGKEKWTKTKGINYPHKGWWSKTESLDLSVFDIQPHPEVHADLLESIKKGQTNWLLTSRLPRLKNEIFAILKKFGIESTEFDGFSFASHLDKGKRILNIIDTTYVSEVHVYEDRDVEIVVLEAIREGLEVNGIKYIIHKIDNGEC